MQIVYQGFTGSTAIEAEACVQLLRLHRFAPALAGCHLAIERPLQGFRRRLRPKRSTEPADSDDAVALPGPAVATTGR